MSAPWDKYKTSNPWEKYKNEGPTEIESGLRGAAQGVSLGFADEATAGIESLLTDKTYEDAIKESRANYKSAEEANPASYMGGNVAGSVGAAFIPGLNVAKVASLGGRVATAAAGGALSGLGNSEATDAMGMAQDTAIGAGLGAGVQGVGEKVLAPAFKGAMKGAGSFTDRVMQAANTKVSPTANRLMSKVASFTSKVDSDAALRQIERPAQVAAAEADGFAYKIGKQAVHDTETMGHTLGTNVGKAKEAFLAKSGDDVHDVGVLFNKTQEFLEANKPSARGFSGISDSQRKDLTELQKMLDGPLNGEDLVKVRDYLDHVERLAGKYDQEGTGPFIGHLKHLRGTADGILDRVAPNIDASNKAFAQYKDDTGLLRSATNEGQSERMIGNLYGANKNAQQEAAGRLFMPDTLDAAKDIAANKSFDAATRPGGDNYFRRGALGVLTLGASEAVTNPDHWKKGLRGVGRLEHAIKANPQMFGQYSQVLSDALSRGPKALAATHFILSQKDAQYREQMKALDKDEP